MLSKIVVDRVMNGEVLFIKGDKVSSKCTVSGRNTVKVELTFRSGGTGSMHYTQEQFRNIVAEAQYSEVNKLEFQGGI